jgi:pyrroloquinoline-quinone synthase
MNPQDTLDRLDQLILSRSILRHPFYVAWQHGELTAEQLATYAQVYYPHVAAFPRYLVAAIDSTSDPVIRAELERNLADELMVPKAHNELWLDFAESLGMERASVASADLHPAAEAIVHAFDRLTGDGSVRALAALYAYESQQPEVSREKMDGLRRDYGVDSPKALAYFEVHAETDIHHRQGERQALSRCLEDGASAEAVLDSAAQALQAYWGLLDGVCVEAGIPITG